MSKKPYTYRYITVPQAAELLGVSRWTMLRWLTKLDEDSKGTVLVKMGSGPRKKNFVTYKTLKRVMPEAFNTFSRKTYEFDELLGRMRQFESQMRSIQSRMNALNRVVKDHAKAPRCE